MDTSTSLYERYIDRPRSWRQLLMLALVLLLLPPLFAALDDSLKSFFSQDHWRIAYLPVAMILYVILISKPLGHSSQVALDAFRSVVQLDDEAYSRLLQQARHVKPAHELTGICVGMALGLLNVSTWGMEQGFYWSKLYLYLSMGVMYALLAWTLVITVSWTHLTRELHRQPLQFDLFDTTPFEPVGRQSLIIALVIIGGLTISLLFTFQPENLRLPAFWVVNAIMVLIPLVIFFLSLRPTHALLAAEKRHQLDSVQRLIVETSRELVRRMEQRETSQRSTETSTLAAELSALAVYEQHLETARTWPYNTAMLRTLFLTGLVPVGTLFVRLISELGLVEF
jgi:hypothetical protein